MFYNMFKLEIDFFYISIELLFSDNIDYII